MRRRRTFWGCSHSATITTITAGIAREVCELCSHVSVSYVETAVRIHPDIESFGRDQGNRAEPTRSDVEAARAFEAMLIFETNRVIRCGVCAQAAVFMIPDGLRCDEHAWQAAALLDWDDADPWVPIRIDRSNA